MKHLLSSIIAVTLAVTLQAQGVKAGPWTGDTTENSITILWTSEVPGMAWVEYRTDASSGTQTLYELYAGRRIFRRLHSVKISGLQRGSVLQYRVCGQNLTDDSNARNPKFGSTYEGPWHAVRTLDTKSRSCRFTVLNDIHMRRSEYSRMADQIDSAATDFIFLNGDIVSAGNYVTDTLVRYAVEPLGTLTAGIPLFFARGNHEGRGNNPTLIADVFPHSDPAPFYYTFRQGPVAFIVFDAGETHEKRSTLYCGKEVYEDYLLEQMEWARKAMREPQWRSAPVKVCLIHVPMLRKEYTLYSWLNANMVPMLNKAGVDMMIGADLHEFVMADAGTMGNDFPIIVNSEIRRLDFSYERGGTIDVRIFKPSGAMEFERSFKVR